MDSGSHKPNSMPNSFSRVEVITGVGRRRQWTPEQKARIVAESCMPSTTVSAVARPSGAWRQLDPKRYRTGAELRPADRGFPAGSGHGYRGAPAGFAASDRSGGGQTVDPGAARCR
jgi:transposase